MELVEGETLTAIVRKSPVELTLALKLFRQIADGLAAAHAKGIVHRDLKTGNVMVTPEGDAKILDFGLAKSSALSETPLSVEGGLLGTFHCMSPEQAQGLEIDHRSDLFSLGALIYETLTGVAPFRSGTVHETLAKVCMHRQRPVHELDGAIPESLSDLVDRLLQKEPSSRPRNVKEVAALLTEIEASSASPSAPVEARRAAKDEAPLASAVTVISETIGSAVVGHWKRRSLGLVVAGLILLALIWRLTTVGPTTTTSPGSPAVRIRPAIAVLGFEDASPVAGTDWLSTAMSEVLASQLSAGGEIRTVEGQRVS
jgi:serine/threonine protein kinase